MQQAMTEDEQSPLKSTWVTPMISILSMIDIKTSISGVNESLCGCAIIS